MSADRPQSSHDDSLARARTVNRRCEAFEAAWRSGERPRISDYLESIDPADRSGLFRELLALEIELCREAGQAPSAADYEAKYPNYASCVASAFAETESAGDRPAPCGTGHSRTVSIPESQPGGTPDFSTHATIGEYELIEELARGGMGVVYKARHKGLKRLVALKMILSGSMATFEERQRFLREAELAANLDHPNIVPIYEVDEHEDRPFFSMKLVDGGSLARHSGRYRQDPGAAARLVSILAQAVHHAHEQGFLHCDLKPSNVLLDGHGKPYVTDFGLARRTGSDSTLSISGAILGTPSYMAPEQATGSRARLGPATDVYGLGAILYELLTGRPPFRSPTIMETIVQVLERDPAPPRELRPEIPRELETICLKCLEKASKDRYATAQALANELDHFSQGEGIEATGIVPRLRRWNRREPELTARLGGLGLMAFITQINYHMSSQPDWRLHTKIQAVLAGWAIASFLFHVLLRWGFRPDRVRVLWLTADIICMTIVLKLLESIEPGSSPGEVVVRVETSLLIGFPLLIAASGLWWREHLVWITTAMAMAAFCGLYVDAAVRPRDGRLTWSPSPDLIHPNIFLAGLILTGYVVVRQVKRILALGRYYEHRSDA